MTSITDGAVIIQTSSESVPSTPSWFGEVTLLVSYLRKHGILTKISERVRFARRRFGPYEVIDFVVVLFRYAERRRTHARDVLRATSAFCRSFHGTLRTRSPACPLDVLALFGSSDRRAN